MQTSEQFKGFREALRERGVTLQTCWQKPVEGVGTAECFLIHGGHHEGPFLAVAVHYEDPRDGYGWFPESRSIGIEADVIALLPYRNFKAQYWIGDRQECDFLIVRGRTEDEAWQALLDQLGTGRKFTRGSINETTETQEDCIA